MPLVGLQPETTPDAVRPAGPVRPRLRWPFWVLLGLFLGVMTLGVNELWLFGHEGWNGSRRGVAGVNYVRHGFLDTKFAPVENLGPAPKEEWKVYWHHPVLIHVLTGVAFTAFGVHEWAARLVPILLSTLSFVLLYLLALRWWGRRGAVATALSFTSLPLLGFYGKMVNHEPLVLALSLTLVWLLVRFHEARRWRHVIAAGGLALLGSFSDWPWFLVLFAVGVAELVRVLARWRRERDVRFLAVLSVCAVVGLVAVAYYLSRFAGGGGFEKLFSDRSGAGSSHGFASLWARRDWYGELFGPVSTVAGAIWLLTFVPRAIGRRLGPADALVGGSFLVGLAWLRLFAQAAYIHEYWAFYLVPFLALSTAWLLLAVADGAAGLVRRWRSPHSTAPRRVGAALLALGLALTVVAGGRGILARQRTPSDVGQQAPEFRFRYAIVGEWLRQRLAPEDRVLLHDAIPIAFQLGFYLRRNFDRVRIHERFRTAQVRKGHRVLLVDRTHLPPDAAVRILTALAARYPTTVIDRFCVFDLRADENRPQSIAAYRIVFDRPSLLWRWFESLVYPPYDVVYSPAASFQWALHLDLDRAAARLAPTVPLPSLLPSATASAEIDRLHDWVAWHNAQRLRGLPTTAAAAALGAAFGPPDDVRFDAEVGLEGMAFLALSGDRLAALPLFRGLVDGGETRPLKVHMDRRPAAPVAAWRRLPFFGGGERVWHVIDPRPGAWRPDLLYVDAFPFPDEPYPQEVRLFLERRRKTRKRELFAAPKRRRAPVVGSVAPDAERRHDPDAPYAWIEAVRAACAPVTAAGRVRLPDRCMARLKPRLDIAATTTFSGDDTLRFDGLKYVGRSGGRTWYQVFLTAVDRIDADWDVGIAIARPRKGDRPPGYFAGPAGAAATGGMRPGETAVLTFAATGAEGPYDVWLRIRREDRSGGRLRVHGAERRRAVHVPVRLSPHQAPGAAAGRDG